VRNEKLVRSQVPLTVDAPESTYLAIPVLDLLGVNRSTPSGGHVTSFVDSTEGYAATTHIWKSGC
jgi:hypothetical protein